MIKVSFDFDGSIGHKKSLQEYAKELIARKIDVHIVTRRYDDPSKYGKLFCEAYRIKDIQKEHQELFEVAEECGIISKNIHFMNMIDKFRFFFENKDFLWHLDDDQFECNDINKNTDTAAIQCNSSNWKQKCERLIKKKLKE